MILPLLRQSERSTFKRCPQRWAWSYLEGLIPNTEDRGARWFGTGLHLCFAEWYIPGIKRGRPLAETWDEYTKDSYETIRVKSDLDGQPDMYEDARELGFNIIAQYEGRYGVDPHWEVIAPEQRFKAMIPDPRNMKQAIAQNVGTMDLVVRDLNDGRIKMVDHKTAGQIQTSHLSIDDQAGSYIALGTFVLRNLGLIGPKEAIAGMEYNFVRKARADTRPINSDGLRTNLPKKAHFFEELNKHFELTGKETLANLQKIAEDNGIQVFGDPSAKQPKSNFERIFVARTTRERNNQIKRIGAEVVVMNQFREGALPLIKNPTHNCPFDCDFFDLCQLDEIDPAGAEEFKKMAFSTRDPYFDHREGAENSKTSVKNDAITKKEATNG